MSDEIGSAARVRGALRAAAAAGYASGATAESLPDGTSRLIYEANGTRVDDSWAGGDPFGGRMLVSLDGHPTWICVYYGAVVAGADPNAAYAFLREALMAAPDDLPVRGPRTLRRADLEYRSKVSGTLDGFTGEESIERGAEAIYRGWFAGGLVDRRTG